MKGVIRMLTLTELTSILSAKDISFIEVHNDVTRSVRIIVDSDDGHLVYIFNCCYDGDLRINNVAYRPESFDEISKNYLTDMIMDGFCSYVTVSHGSNKLKYASRQLRAAEKYNGICKTDSDEEAAKKFARILGLNE